jgi:DNA invertase Pin-like site-specific DNA recombinase
MQRERIEGFAASRGLSVVMLEAELDVSGGALERPVLSQAIEAIEAGQAEGIVVAQLDRLSRLSLIDALKVIRRIEDAGGQVLAAGESFDTSTPEGRMGRNVFLSMAEMQLERYKGQFKVAKIQAVERGIWPTYRAPRGYRIGADRRLEPDPETAPKVRRAFELRAQGKSWAVIAELLGCGISGAGKTIRNRVYLGELSLGGSVGAHNPAAHEPLVDRALFEAAQLKHARPARRGRPPALLGGLIRCAGCQCSMTPNHPGYSCYPRTASGRCQAPAWISMRAVEAFVEEVVLSHLAELRPIEGRPHSDAGDFASGQLAEAEGELVAFQESTRAAGVGAEHFAVGLRQRVERVERARRELARARAASGDQGRLADAVGVWSELSAEERRQVVRGAIGVVWVRRGRGVEPVERVRVIAAGYEPLGLSGPGRRAAMIPLDWVDELPGEIRVAEAEGQEERVG